jgi:sRNA-binding protein
MTGEHGKAASDARWKEYRDRMLRELAEILLPEGPGHADLLPRVFLSFHPKALKIGIARDLMDIYGRADPAKLGWWFHRWCSSTRYLKRIANGTNRHDLAGNDCGVIADGERSHAAGRLKKRAKIMQGCKQKLAA